MGNNCAADKMQPGPGNTNQGPATVHKIRGKLPLIACEEIVNQATKLT